MNKDDMDVNELIELNARLVHEASTPMAVAKMNNEFIARYLPALLSAYEARTGEGQQPAIPPEHVEAIRNAPALIEQQCIRVEEKVKAHWQTVSQLLRADEPEDPEESPSESGREPASLSAETVEGLSILLVEDEAVHRDIALKLLAPVHNVDLACDGREAIEMSRNQSYEVILLDLCLPDLDGHQVSRLIRRSEGSRPGIIALSNMPVGKQELREAGFDGQLEKPLKLTEFKRLLLRIPIPEHGEN